MFAVTGCSFSRGERLFYHRYADTKDKKETGPAGQDLLEYFIPKDSPHNGELEIPKTHRGYRVNIPIFGKAHDSEHMAMATIEDKRFQLDLTAAGLLSKKLNCEYLQSSGHNDGNHNQIRKWIDLSNRVSERKLDFIIWQLTDPQRDLDDVGNFWDKLNSISTPPEEKKKLWNHITNEIPQKTVGHIVELDKKCKESDIDLFVWSWQDDIAKLINNEDYFVRLVHGDKWYRSHGHFYETSGLNVQLDQIFNVEDSHPNKFFNEVLYNSLLIKLRQRGYEI